MNHKETLELVESLDSEILNILSDQWFSVECIRGMLNKLLYRNSRKVGYQLIEHLSTNDVSARCAYLAGQGKVDFNIVLSEDNSISYIYKEKHSK